MALALDAKLETKRCPEPIRPGAAHGDGNSREALKRGQSFRIGPFTFGATRSDIDAAGSAVQMRPLAGR